jgi:hypothetical protein
VSSSVAGATSGFHLRGLLRRSFREQGSVDPRPAAGETSHPLSAMCVLACCSAVKKCVLGAACTASQVDLESRGL